MYRPLDPKLIVNLAQDVVKELAQEEHLYFFSSISEAYKRNPKRILKKQRVGDALSFASAQSVEPLLTPRILLILHQAFVLMRVDNTKREGWFFLRRLRKKTFNSIGEEKNELGLPQFSSEELEHIHEFLMEAARENKFTAAEALQFADIVKERLDITRTLGK